MMLFAEGTLDPNQLLGFGAIGTALMIINQFFSWLREYRKEQATLKAAALLANTQARRDDVAIRKDELALCNAEDDHVVTGYEKLLERTNKRLEHVEAELAKVQTLLADCKTEHARSEERARHYEERFAQLDRKYNALKKKIPGIDSDTVLMPDEEPKKK